MADKRKLKVWADPEYEEPQEVGRPFPGEALYTRQNPDGSRKNCRNCVHWIGDEEQCFIMSEDVVVPADGICGYHVYGRPRTLDAEAREGMQPVEPEHSGFDVVAGGVSCDQCEHYRSVSPVDGKCALLLDPDEDTDLSVHPLAGCSHWVPNG